MAFYSINRMTRQNIQVLASSLLQRRPETLLCSHTQQSPSGARACWLDREMTIIIFIHSSLSAKVSACDKKKFSGGGGGDKGKELDLENRESQTCVASL